MRVLCLVLAFVLFFPASYAASAEDTLSALSRIEGADMTMYSLYDPSDSTPAKYCYNSDLQYINVL